MALVPIHIDPSQSALHVQLEIDESEWRRRRRFDGFVLLIAHRELRLSASDLVLLYRAKDAVEKDFQTIKALPPNFVNPALNIADRSAEKDRRNGGGVAQAQKLHYGRVHPLKRRRFDGTIGPEIGGESWAWTRKTCPRTS